MKTIELAAKPDLEQVLQQAKSEDVVLLRDGRAVALVSEIDDDELYWYARERDPAFLESIAKGREQVNAGQVVRHSELKHELGLD